MLKIKHEILKEVSSVLNWFWSQSTCEVRSSRSGAVVLLGGLLLLSGCMAASEPVLKSGSSPSLLASPELKKEASVSKEPQTARRLDAARMYQVLVAEMMVLKGYNQQAFEVMYMLANESKDEKASERAFQLSMQTYDVNKIAAATNLWRELSPESVVAWRASYLLALRNNQIELAVKQWQEFQNLSEEPLSEDLTLTAQRVVTTVAPETGLLFFKRLTEIYPREAVVYFASALAADSYGRFDQALSSAEEAQKRFQNEKVPAGLEAQLFQLLAKLYVQQGQTDKGLSLLTPYLLKNPSDWLVQERLARLEVQAGLLTSAEERYQLILASVPDAVTSRLSLALIQIERKSYSKAKGHLLKVAELKGYVNVSSYYLGLIAQEENNSAAALNYFKKVQSSNYYIDAQLHKAEIYFELKQPDKALEVLDNAKPTTPTDKVKLHRARGVFYTIEHKIELAIEQYERALAIDPNNIDVLMSQALVLYNTERYDAYEATLKKVVEIRPNEVDALNALGYYYVDSAQNFVEAEVLLKRAFKLDPDSYYVMDSLGWLYYHQQKYDLAEELLSKAIALEMDDEVLVHLISTYWKLGNLSKAKSLWQDNHQKFLNNKELQGLIKQLELE